MNRHPMGPLSFPSMICLCACLSGCSGYALVNHLNGTDGATGRFLFTASLKPDQFVRVTTRDGGVVEGRLVSVDSEHMVLCEDYLEGPALYRLAADEVTCVQLRKTLWVPGLIVGAFSVADVYLIISSHERREGFSPQ